MNEDVYHNNNIAIERDFMSYELWSKTFYFGNMKKKKNNVLAKEITHLEHHLIN
jgi:hypothetical protein